MVLEFCSLGSLSDVLRITNRKKLNERQIASLCKAVLNGLSYLHSRRLMHRDIKPENILLTENAEPKLGIIPMD